MLDFVDSLSCAVRQLILSSPFAIWFERSQQVSFYFVRILHVWLRYVNATDEKLSRSYTSYQYRSLRSSTEEDFLRVNPALRKDNVPDPEHCVYVHIL